jgi:hypothetical protein
LYSREVDGSLQDTARWNGKCTHSISVGFTVDKTSAKQYDTPLYWLLYYVASLHSKCLRIKVREIYGKKQAITRNERHGKRATTKNTSL